MKHIYLRVEYYKKDERVLCEYHEATMDKNYVYFDKYKIKKVDTEEYEEKDRSLHDRPARCIKLYNTTKKTDSRFIVNS